MENSTIQLTINDLAVLRDIVDLAVSRGAFRANEVRTVGETFEKLDTFIQAIQKAGAENSVTDDEPTQGETND